MGKNIIYIVLAAVFFIAVDVFSRFLYAQSWFSKTVVLNEINPLDIISLSVSTILAILLGWYFSKKLTVQRYEKEYIISDIKQIADEIITIEREMKVSNMELQELLNILNNFKIYIDRFTKTIDIFQVTSINTDNLCNYYSHLYQITTNTDGNQFNIDETARIEISNICSSFILETRQMIFKLNKE